MPWREVSIKEERSRFVVLAHARAAPMSKLCGEFGISRQTGYTWLRRFEAGAELADRPRRPQHIPRQTPPEIEAAVAELRGRWPDWGARKLLKLLSEAHPEWMPLSASTVHRIIARRDLIRERDSRRPATGRFERSAPNELWQMDFKGPLGNGASPVGPLSIVDDHSRYILALEQLGSTRMEGVRRRVERAFEEAGLPDAMLVDHGTPWWNAASPWGITELAVWIMQQGVRLTYSGIRHPQTQGKVERMHGALGRAVRLRKADAEDQSWLDMFRQEYNHVRPHEALGMATPASRWRPSPRAFQPHPPEWDYAPELEVYRLGGDGQLGWRGRRWEISCALRGQRVGIGVVGQRAIVFFCATPMRTLDLANGTATPVAADVLRLQEL